MSDLRFIALNAWIERVLSANATIKLISGDASFRRYFRVTLGPKRYIAMDSPPDLIAVSPFIALANEYHQQGINVPQVIEKNIEQGFLLLSDLGDTQLLSVLTPANVSDYYQQALCLLTPIRAVTRVDGVPLPSYDEAFVYRELDIFSDWLIGRHLQLKCSADTQQMLADTYRILADSALVQPRAGMHRDFHSRNLMLCDKQLAVIDFQDAVIGPVTYDAVSLLRDCYVRWPDEVVETLMQQHYLQLLSDNVLGQDVTLAQYRHWFDLMGMQRHLKAAGIFCRLNYRDGKPSYMQDIMLTLQYVSDIGKRYLALHPFISWLDNQVIPKMEQTL